VAHRFVEAAKRAGLAFGWRFLEAAEPLGAAALARPYDLVLAGQADPDDPEASFSGKFPESLVMDAGRPVLLLPRSAHDPSFAIRRVLVAWNGSREAARAVGDAMPLLRRAEAVRVVSAESASGERDGARLPEVDVAAWLARHGVRSELASVLRDERDVGAWLLSTANDFDADLIVAGAYGHSRIREFVLGGVTRTLLRSMAVPVLMSH
jgi:nucleotide-binding universal stress UspA family protein